MLSTWSLWRCMIAAIAVAGIAASTAKAAEPKYAWEVKKGNNAAETLKEGEKLELVPTLVSPAIEIAWTRNAVKIKIKCTSAGWRSEAPERVDVIGGKPGRMGESITKGLAMALSGCTVEEPLGCEVAGNAITTEALRGELVSNPKKEEAGWIRLETANSIFMPITLEADCGAAKGTASVVGELLVELNPEKGLKETLEFKPNSSLGEYLIAGGNKLKIATLYSAAGCGPVSPVTVGGKFGAKLFLTKTEKAEFGFS